MDNKIYVGNLAWEVENEDLRNAFLEVGNVVDVLVVKNRRGRSKGFGFVEFETPEAVQTAIAQMNGKELKGRNMVVREARPPRTDQAPEGGVQPEVPAQSVEPKSTEVMTAEMPAVVSKDVVQGEVTIGQTTEVVPSKDEDTSVE